MTGLGVVSGGRFRVSLGCPDSEWLDPRRNVFELGGKLPPALRAGLADTLARAAAAILGGLPNNWAIIGFNGRGCGCWFLFGSRAWCGIRGDVALARSLR